MRRVMMLTLGLGLLVPVVAEAGTIRITIPNGQRVVVRPKGEISTETARKRQEVEFVTIQPLIVKDRIIVESGATALGQVREVKKGGIFGRGGKLAITVHTLKTVDGQDIHVYAREEDQGDNKDGTTLAAAAIALPAGALVKGKNTALTPQMKIVIEVIGDQRFEIDSAALAAANGSR